MKKSKNRTSAEIETTADEYGGGKIQCNKCTNWCGPDLGGYIKNHGWVCGNCQHFYHDEEVIDVDSYQKHIDKIVAGNLVALSKHKSRAEVQLRAALKYSPIKNTLCEYIDIVDEIINEIIETKGGENV